MTFKIVKNDITKMETEAIVNPTNEDLQMGWGVSGAIFSVAGIDDLQEECNSLGKCPIGKAVITDGYKLPAKHIIHTVGPVWTGGNNNEENFLYSAYMSSLKLALKNEIKSISFPLISSGTYGYPIEKAIEVAVRAIEDFLSEHEMEVYLVLFGIDLGVLSKDLSSKIMRYIH